MVSDLGQDDALRELCRVQAVQVLMHAFAPPSPRAVAAWVDKTADMWPVVRPPRGMLVSALTEAVAAEAAVMYSLYAQYQDDRAESADRAGDDDAG